MFSRSQPLFAVGTPQDEGHVVVRRAAASDWWALWRLSHRDTRPIPPGELWLAEVDGAVVAAVSIETGDAIAEPFRLTAHLVRMLRAYAGLSEAPAA